MQLTDWLLLEMALLLIGLSESLRQNPVLTEYFLVRRYKPRVLTALCVGSFKIEVRYCRPTVSVNSVVSVAE
jgi:hypothetical protein